MWRLCSKKWDNGSQKCPKLHDFRVKGRQNSGNSPVNKVDFWTKIEENFMNSANARVKHSFHILYMSFCVLLQIFTSSPDILGLGRIYRITVRTTPLPSTTFNRCRYTPHKKMSYMNIGNLNITQFVIKGWICKILVNIIFSL